MSEFAGRLNERIRIEHPLGERTPMGVWQSAWEELCTCRAAVDVDGAGAESEAQALSAMPKYRVTIRKREGIAIDQRISWRGRLLMIRQVLDDPHMKDRTVMRCEEIRQ